MLEKIFSSEIKIKILNLLFSQEKDFSISSEEMAKNLNLKGIVWRRDLNDLIETGLLLLIDEKEDKTIPPSETKDTKKKTLEGKKKTIKVKKELVVKLNDKFFLYSEIKNLLAKSRIILTTNLFKNIEDTCKPKLLVLSGKFSANKDSLVDLLLVGDIPKKILSKLILDLEQAIGEEVNYSVMTEEEFSYRRFVMDIFVYNIINNDNIVLIGDVDDLTIVNKSEKI